MNTLSLSQSGTPSCFATKQRVQALGGVGMVIAALLVTSGCFFEPSSSVSTKHQTAKPKVQHPKKPAVSLQPKDIDSKTSNGIADVLSLTVKTLEGKEQPLSAYRGKALLIVNTASQCGYTPQYAKLEKLYEAYRKQGFEILAFPSNDFGGQEPGSAEEIREFVDDKYQITFPIFEKLHAKGKAKSPLYKALTERTGEKLQGEVRWNFTKFLLNPEGKVVARFDSKVDPLDPGVTALVEAVLPNAGSAPVRASGADSADASPEGAPLPKVVIPIKHP